MIFGTKLRPGFRPETLSMTYGDAVSFRGPTSRGVIMTYLPPTTSGYESVKSVYITNGFRHLVDDHELLHRLESRYPVPPLTREYMYSS
jgi:hypothetical protein